MATRAAVLRRSSLMHRDEARGAARMRAGRRAAGPDRRAGPGNTLPRMIYETEVERVSFLLRSYLRWRILKIQSQALPRARPERAGAALGAGEDLRGPVRRALPAPRRPRAWQLGDTSRLPDDLKQITRVQQLATPPNLDSHVFCVATRDCDPFRIEGLDRDGRPQGAGRAPPVRAAPPADRAGGCAARLMKSLSACAARQASRRVPRVLLRAGEILYLCAFALCV